MTYAPTVEIEINGTTAAAGRYISYTPSPCRIRQPGGITDLSVTLESAPAQAGGGQAVLYSTPSAPSAATLPLNLPADGAWVEFWMGGKFGQPSVEDGDCLLKVTGEVSEQVALMVRVRKNANTLQPGERARFLSALATVNAAGTGPYQDLRDMHVSAADPEEHGGPQFLVWHRAYLLDLEREMQKVDPSVSQHYWRFDEPAPNVFRSDFMGATQQGPQSPVSFDPANPLTGWVTDGTPGIVRGARFDTQTSAAPGPPGFALRSQAATLALGTSYSQFRDMEGTPHGAAHVSFRGSISSIPTAPKDPLFFMLHANVDRLWALWQWVNRRMDPTDADVYTGQDRDGRRLGDTMWPWNGVTTPPRPGFAPRAAQGNQGGLAASPTTPAPGNVPTVMSVVDYQGHTTPAAQIGYGYDDVPYEF